LQKAFRTAAAIQQEGEIMQKMIPLIVVASLAIGGCAKGAQSAGGDTAKITDTIKAQDAQWAKDYAAKDVNAIEGHYTTDGTLAGPGYIASTATDRRAVLTAFMSDPNFTQKFSPDRVDVSPSGDFASSRGRFVVTMTDPIKAKPIDYAGSYLTVYKKESDGSWKAINRFLTVGPEPTAAAAQK
jgi:ketosteroid isomerase-like protein